MAPASTREPVIQRPGCEPVEHAPGTSGRAADLGRLQVAERRDGSCVGLALTGELDLAGAERVAVAVDRALGSDAELELDLSGVTFIDSSGVHILIGVVRRCERAGRGLRLVRPLAPGPRRLFQTLGLDRLMPWLE